MGHTIISICICGYRAAYSTTPCPNYHNPIGLFSQVQPSNA